MGKSGKQTSAAIKKSLINQLRAKGLDTPYNLDRINDYMYMWECKEKLRKDIDENEVIERYLDKDGYDRIAVNKSVERFASLVGRMQTLLNKLGIDVPADGEDDEL